jgi:MFS transporter, DHA1 family, multidrug resistance protein
MSAHPDVGGATQRRVLVLLCVQVAALHAGSSMIIPILPLFAQTFGVSLALVGVLLAVQAVPRLFVSVPAGRLADRIGAHRLLAISCLVSVVASIGSMLAPSFVFLVAMRVVQAVAVAGSQTAGLTYAASIGGSSRRGRKISIYQGSFLLGNGVGPVLGGVLAVQFGYRVPFGIYAAIALVVGIWIVLRLPDPRTTDVTSAGESEEAEGGARMSVWTMLVTGAILTACLMGLLSAYTRSGSRDYALVVLSNERGIGTGVIGLSLTVLFLLNVAAMYVVGALIDQFGPRAVMGPSWIMVGIGLALLAAVPFTWALFVAVILYGLGAGFGNSAPAVQIANSVSSSSRGAALGLYRTFNDIGLVVGAAVMALAAAVLDVTWGVWLNVALVLAAGVVCFVAPGVFTDDSSRPHEAADTETRQPGAKT